MTKGQKQASSKQRGEETDSNRSPGMSGGDWTSWLGGGRKLTLSKGDSKQSGKFRFDTGREGGAETE